MPLTNSPQTGDVVTVLFVGAVGTKRRPAVVVSGQTYHGSRPDCILAALTTQTRAATAPTDYVLQDFAQAGLRQPSAFRAYFNMALPADVTVIGHLSPRDLKAVQERVALAFGLPPLP